MVYSLQLNSYFIRPKKGIFDYTRYDKTLDKALNPEAVFVVIEDTAHRLRGHTSLNEEKYNPDKSQVLEAPFDSLRQYLSNTKGDKVIVTKEPLVEKVESAIKQFGFDTARFSI
ncbi:hypothetical protein HYW20_05020 [Candidatus Woesearchaeota archaeon]|nr:hypothetical protein [Candidatus Woesearchaeota archaeon]